METFSSSIDRKKGYKIDYSIFKLPDIVNFTLQQIGNTHQFVKVNYYIKSENSRVFYYE